jgi:hypothetical protein
VPVLGRVKTAHDTEAATAARVQIKGFAGDYGMRSSPAWSNAGLCISDPSNLTSACYYPISHLREGKVMEPTQQYDRFCQEKVTLASNSSILAKTRLLHQGIKERKDQLR